MAVLTTGRLAEKWRRCRFTKINASTDCICVNEILAKRQSREVKIVWFG
jgi:hypothetical protein